MPHLEECIEVLLTPPESALDLRLVVAQDACEKAWERVAVLHRVKDLATVAVQERLEEACDKANSSSQLGSSSSICLETRDKPISNRVSASLTKSSKPRTGMVNAPLHRAHLRPTHEVQASHSFLDRPRHHRKQSVCVHRLPMAQHFAHAVLRASLGSFTSAKSGHQQYVQERARRVQHRLQIRFQVEPAAVHHLRTLVREDVGLLEPLVRLAEMFFGTVSRWHVLGTATPTDVLVKFSINWVFHSETECMRVGVLELPVMCCA